jgi:hypothetical protein
MPTLFWRIHMQSAMKNLLSSFLTWRWLPKSDLQPTPPSSLQFTPSSAQAPYVRMLLELDQIPTFHNILAGFFTWILLAGYVVLPGTFKSLIGTAAARFASEIGTEGSAMKVVQNPLFWIAAICCTIGACGMIWLWYAWKRNYVWVINRLFM